MTLSDRMLDAMRQELARTLAALCTEVDAAESSILLPAGPEQLTFFASSNPALMQPGVPAVPVNASFSGLAFRTGQTIAIADAANQDRHFGAVDELVGKKTREFAVIPLFDRVTLGVVTLASRPDVAGGGSGDTRPFTLTELRHAEQAARELARPIAALSGLMGTAAVETDAVDPALLAELSQLREPERRIVHSLASALLHNRED